MILFLCWNNNEMRLLLLCLVLSELIVVIGHSVILTDVKNDFNYLFLVQFMDVVMETYLPYVFVLFAQFTSIIVIMHIIVCI